MKSSIKFLAITALFVTFTFAINAQRGGGESLAPEKMAEKQTAQMVKELGINDMQTSQITSINLAYAKEMQEAHKANKDNRDAMKEISSAIQSRKNAEMKLVLTEAQFKTYGEVHPRDRKGGKGQKGGKCEKGGKGGCKSK